MTKFEYRQSATNPSLIEIRHKHTQGGRPSYWRPYLVRQSEAEALRLLEILTGQALQDKRERAPAPVDDIEWLVSRYFFLVERGQDARLDRINDWLDQVKPLEPFGIGPEATP